MGVEVLFPLNFDGHKYVKNNVDDMVKLGFRFGTKVELTKRITVDFDNSKANNRKDFAKSTEVFVKGYAVDKVVVHFEAMFGKVRKSADVALKISNIKLLEQKLGDENKVSSTKWMKSYPFLAKDGCTAEVVPLATWDQKLMANDQKIQAEYKKSSIGFVLDNLLHCTDTLAHDDLLVAKRGANYEVWTLRDFKAGSLTLVPESTELKPRFYTADRSVICKNTTDPASEDKRPFLIDGRVRANPECDSKSSFSLFLARRAHCR